MPVQIPSEFRRGRLREFYLEGFEFGSSVGNDWIVGEAAEETVEALQDNPHIGQMIGEWLSNLAQYADTIYYESGVTDRQLEAWETGVHDGIIEIVVPWAEEREIELE